MNSNPEYLEIRVSGAFKEVSVALRYTLAGIINTIVGYVVFWVMLTWGNLSPNASNAVGYAVALSLAFHLNRSYVFDVRSYKASHYIKFIFSFAISFGSNQLILWWLVFGVGVRPELSQVVAMVFYTSIFYALNRFFVYR